MEKTCLCVKNNLPSKEETKMALKRKTLRASKFRCLLRAVILSLKTFLTERL